MATKMQLAKDAQGYTTAPKSCGNCANRTCKRVLPEWMVQANERRGQKTYLLASHGVERDQRCGLGGFAIKKTATCAQWLAKVPA